MTLKPRSIKTYYISYNNIIRPEKEKMPNLKPQSLGIHGKYRNVEALALAVYKGFRTLAERSTLIEPETVEYITCLLALYSRQIGTSDGNSLTPETAKKQIELMWPSWKGILPLADIGKDFAEMLGPMWIEQNKFSSQERKLVGIVFPRQGNYPLVDYFMYFKNTDVKGADIKRLKFSAKSNISASANTVKLSTVYDDILKWPTEKKRAFLENWRKSIIYQLVKECNRLVKEKERTKATISDVNINLRTWCLLKGVGKVNLEGNKFWSDVSRVYSKDLKAFFADFIDKNIYYVVFNIDRKTGLPKFILDFNALSLVNVKLKELTEQLGFEPKFGEKNLVV